MIAPYNGRQAMLETIGILAVSARVRRCRHARAYADKEGGWTLVTPWGLALRLTGGAAVGAWEAFQGGGAVLGELATDLGRRFPGIPPERVLRDLLDFTAHLLSAGFVEVAACLPARGVGRPPRRAAGAGGAAIGPRAVAGDPGAADDRRDRAGGRGGDASDLAAE